MIGLFAHMEKPGAGDVVRAAVAALTKRNAKFLIEKRTAESAGLRSALSIEELAARSELLVVMGGDGTILRMHHQIQDTLPPIFGINTGTLGFLTCMSSSELDEAIESILGRTYVLSERRLLRAALRHASGATAEFEGLNDAVMSRGERSRLVKLRVLIDGVALTEYFADGLIVATPTGSTAYSLSAGGPILMPESCSFVVTPICPHVLTNRSVVVCDDSVIRIEPAADDQQVFLTIDGREARRLGGGDSVEIRRSSRTLPLAMLPDRSFSDVLRQKLKWSGSNI